jgi:hypothetical protein
MKYQLEIEIADDQTAFAEEFFRSVSFIKKVGMLHGKSIVPAKERQIGILNGKINIAFMDDLK